jgi:multidrug transporter EmrE-like cation transporter
MDTLKTLVSLLESMNPFVLLLLAIVCEITGTTALRVSEGFSKPLPVVWVAVSYAISFYLYALVLKQMPMGIAYVIWGGIGGVGVVLVGMMLWHDQISLWQVVGMALILIGAALLNIFTPTTP